MAREFKAPSDLLVLNQPTRGVDVGAISFIHSKILEMRSHNKAILLSSADLNELISLSDRCLLYTSSIGYELTVMDRPMQEMGEIAFGLLTDRMKGPAAKKRRREVMLRTRLIIRGSEKRQGVQEAVL